MNISIAEAKAKLSELVSRAEAGEEIVLTRHGKVAARIVPPAVAAPLPRIGALKGKIRIADDFDELGPEWDEYVKMTVGPFLADTHIILWSIADDRRLSEHHRAILASDAVVFASAASVWEIAIKRSIGKLEAPDDLPGLLPRMQFQPLAITFQHARAVGNLPHHHGDPFDRLLIAQARVENLTILTSDPHFARYEVALA